MEGKLHSTNRMSDISSKTSQMCIGLKEQAHSFAVNKDREIEGEIVIKQSRNTAQLDIKVKNLCAGKVPYKLFLIGRKDGNSVYRVISGIAPDSHGNVRLQTTLNPEDADGQGTPLSCFYIFMVAAPGRPLQPVLKGDLVKPVQKEIGEECRQRHDYTLHYREYIKEKSAALIKARNRFTDISPFSGEWLADNWKRVTEVLKLPVASAGAETQTEHYGHFIFTYTEEHLYLGVPGRHVEEDWPDRGKSGFVMWQPIRGSEEYGYWCMVIDIKTGFITEIS